jgi:(E)-4-hydroxy-3-methylbut-2-enyl-diphosphate synthase
MLAELAEEALKAAPFRAVTPAKESSDKYTYQRRSTRAVGPVGGGQVPVVCHDMANRPLTAAGLYGLGHRYQADLDKWEAEDAACDLILIGDRTCGFALPGWIRAIQDSATWQSDTARPERHHPLWDWEGYVQARESNALDGTFNVLHCDAVALDAEHAATLATWKTDATVLMLSADRADALSVLRSAFHLLEQAGCDMPVVVHQDYGSTEAERIQLQASTEMGGLLLDGFGDGVGFAAAVGVDGGLRFLNRTAFGILQATRTRISRTEYISCPSCGRTLFDLQETTARIRAVTDHLKGVKIGIMGCIVNGPGEMADADYGYVGTGPGKITLYKEKEVVQRNIPEDEAVDALIDLIRTHGDWVETPTA